MGAISVQWLARFFGTHTETDRLFFIIRNTFCLLSRKFCFCDESSKPNENCKIKNFLRLNIRVG